MLAGISKGKTEVVFAARDQIFQQGSIADSLYFVTHGTVQLVVASRDGKEAIVGTLGCAEFFGEGCLAGQPHRIFTATAADPCRLIRVEKAAMACVLHNEPALSSVFVTHLLQRIVRYEADLVDQLFNSSEKRLARLLLLLSHFGKDSKSETVVAGVNQEHLAQMVGTTRSRINHFMNKFRKLGFIDYDNESGLTVHRGLKNILRSDEAA